MSESHHNPDSHSTDERPAHQNVSKAVLETVREWETKNSPVAREDIHAAVTSDKIDADRVDECIDGLERRGELYPVNGGFRVA